MVGKFCFFAVFIMSICQGEILARKELHNLFWGQCQESSDINQHVKTLYALVSQGSSVTEIGCRSMGAVGGILQGLADHPTSARSYIRYDLFEPSEKALQQVERLAQGNGIAFMLNKSRSVLDIEIETTDLLFINSIHTYCMLTYELEKFSPKVKKYIAMHNTSEPWGEFDDFQQYHGDKSEFPLHIDRKKQGLWQAVEDFLVTHPEWVLHERSTTNHGFTVLRRVAETPLREEPWRGLRSNEDYSQKNSIPIQFSIPESKFVKEIPMKTRDFAYIIPGEPSTYIYNTEESYYQGYQSSYFAVTRKKGGWDCLRHYEILANGCIPYFLDIDQCDDQNLSLFPKDLIKAAMHLDGVSYLGIDHRKFDREKYYQILNQLLEYARQNLSTKSMAKYLLQKMNYSGTGKVLFLSGDKEQDYLRCLTLIGLKEVLGDRVIDYPKVDHIYTNYPADTSKLYGKGFSYTKIVDEIPVDRTNLEERIKSHEFDLIICGSVHYRPDFLSLVRHVYDPSKVAYLCGEDDHVCPFRHFTNLFLREFTPNE